MTIQLPEHVRFIIHTLENAGFEAYAVGGCVRDSILNREPNDWDITTSAQPEKVKELFQRTIDTGIQHGTVTVLLDKMGYEVTTYRIDGAYEDSRHPMEVKFTSNLLEDLKRRDFTINAMAYNEKNGLIDAFHGYDDLNQGIVKCVGNARERFTEDALRILRALRFSAQFGFSIEQETKNAISELAETLSKISVERIQVELCKLMTSPHPEWMRNVYETGVTKVIMPEFDAMMETTQNNPHHMYTVGEHALHAMEYVEADRYLRFGMLLHDVGKPTTKSTDEEGIDHFYGHANAGIDIAKRLLRRLKFDNVTIAKVTGIVKYHDYSVNLTPVGVRKAIVKIGIDLFPYILKAKRADILAQSGFEREEKLKKLDLLTKIFETELAKESCVSLKGLAVSGRDLIEEGIKPGKELGQILENLLEEVILDPEKNTKEYLLAKALESL